MCTTEGVGVALLAVLHLRRMRSLACKASQHSVEGDSWGGTGHNVCW